MTKQAPEILVTIVTPTYNRVQCLPRLFESLCAQADGRFDWLVIDDGSTDGTREYIEGLIQSAPISIEYHYKSNGGKHTALNVAFEIVTADLLFIVDSDDYLTSNAIAEICARHTRVFDEGLAGVAFLRRREDGSIIGDTFPCSDTVLDPIDDVRDVGISGDKAEVWRTDVLRSYRFPVFEGEFFQGENYVWTQVVQTHELLYVNEAIYVCEYLPGGLSKSGRRLRIANPRGGMENSHIEYLSRGALQHRAKHALLFVIYARFAGLNPKDILCHSGSWLVIANLLPGLLIYCFWKMKYLHKSS